MNASVPIDVDLPLREKKPTRPFCWVGNEIVDLYVPIIGPDCFAVYIYFARRYHSNPTLKHDVREIACSCRLKPTTVCRSLEVMEHLQLIQLVRFGGSRKSECKLLDVWGVASRLGAEFNAKTQLYHFPETVIARLVMEVREIRMRQQGKAGQNRAIPIAPTCGNPGVSISQRNASLSPEKLQCPFRETQAGPHLLIKEEKIINILKPPPQSQAEKTKSLPDELGAVEDLRWARVKFDGFMHDLKNYVFALRRYPPHLMKGFDDWRSFGFESLAVKRVSWNGAKLVLVLFARDPEAAQKGLEKYRKTSQSILRTWFECDVSVDLTQAQPER